MENYLAYTQLGDKNSENTLVFLHGSTMTKEGMLQILPGVNGSDGFFVARLVKEK